MADARRLYEKVADDLRTTITRGGLQPDDPLPSESELSQQHDVSRQTVRQALQQLTQEGLITGGQGRARTVRNYAPLEWHLSSYESRASHATRDPSGDQWSADVQDQEREPRQDVDVSLTKQPPAIVSKRLTIPPETLVVVRRRIRLVDETPFQLADSYFVEELVHGTLLMEPGDQSAPGGLLAFIGHPQAKYRDEIRVRMPLKDEVTRLQLAPGTPVAEHIRTGYAEDGTPLRVMITIVPGDRHVMVYELDAS